MWCSNVLFLVFSAVDHLSAYYRSCDSFPVAVVTGLDLQDEESIVIAKSVSPLHHLYVQYTICTFSTSSVHTIHHLYLYVQYTTCTYIQYTICTFSTSSVQTVHHLYIPYTICTYCTLFVCLCMIPYRMLCPMTVPMYICIMLCSVTGIQ